MANDKRFVVKNGLTAQNIAFVDDIGTANNTITVSMLGSDTLSFSGDSGQLFSITDSQSGTIFAVNDISGVPSIEVDDDGTIRFAETFGNILIGTATDNATDKVQVDGDVLATNFKGALQGNANTASALETAVNITLDGAVTGTTSFDGSSNVTITTTATADPTLTIDGDASGSATFTNLGNATLTLTIADDSHNHIISNIDGLQTALNAKLDSSSYTAADVLSKLLTVDGATSNLDADLLDGQEGSYYLDYNNFTNTPTDTDTTYDLSIPATGVIRLSDSANSNDDITVVGSGATSVSSNTTHIIISSTDNNTTYSAGNGIDLSGTTFSVAAGSGLTQDATGLSHSDTSTQASLTALTGANVVSDIDLDGFGHVTSLATRAMTLADLGYTGETNATADQTITAGTGLSGGGTGDVTINHSNSITAGTVSEGGSTRTLAYGGSFNVPSVTYDAQGHITATTTVALTLPASDNTDTTYSAGNGLSLTSTTFSVDVSGDSSLIANTSGLFIDDSTLSIATSQLTGDVALGTQTSGNYVATISGTANEIEVSGSGSETASVTIGLPNDVTIGNNLIVSGNLTVSGTTTTVNTETINLADNIITLNSNEAGAPSQNAGIEVERGTSTNVILQWNETSDHWEIASGGTTGRILTTGDEGTGNGLDADTLDGQQGTYYLDYSNFTNTPTIPTVNDSTITISAGSGLTTGGDFTTNQSANETITIDHADTSTQASLTALTGANVVSDIDLDGFGHVTALSTRAMTLADFDANLSSFVSAFTLPTVDGANNQVLTTDGAGGLSFTTPSGGASSINELSDAIAGTTTVGLGSGALASASATNNNTAVGIDAGKDVTSGSSNVFLGTKAGENTTTGIGNVAVGHLSFLNGKGNYNVSLGLQAMGEGNLTGGQYNIAIGYQSGYELTSGDDNTLIGRTAGANMATASDNVAIGPNAMGNGVTTGDDNIAIGASAGEDLTSGTANVLFGRNAGRNITTGSRNIALGDSAMGLGVATEATADNVAIGYLAGYDLTSGKSNILIGDQSGTNITTGTNNVCVGGSTGAALTTGDNNTFIGNNAGDTETGDNNTVIGHNSNASSTSVNNEITLGNTSVTRFRIPGCGIDNTSAALSGTTPSVDVGARDTYTLTTSGNTTFTFTGVPSSGQVGTFSLIITAGGTHTLTWPASVDWAGGSAPDAPASGETDVYTFMTVDGGTTWYGFLAGDAMA